MKLYEDYSIGSRFSLAHRLSAEVIGTTALWAEQHKSTKLMLADIPLSLFKYNTMNSYPLIELERILEKSLYRASLEGISVSQAALLECPDVMLGLSDEYMAAMINKLSETHRNILVICGYGQTRSIPHYLYFSQKANSEGLSTARHKKVYETIVRKDNPET